MKENMEMDGERIGKEMLQKMMVCNGINMLHF